MDYICPRLQITPNIPFHSITDRIKVTIGEIKHTLNFAELKLQPFIFKNNDLVNFFKGTNFIPLPNFYSKEVAEDMDIYGGLYTITKDDIFYDI